MELIFGEGCDGDAQAMIFAPLADAAYNVTIDDTFGEVLSVLNGPGGEITLAKLNDDGEPTGVLATFVIDDIESLEIH